jgi:hypothetical protein
MRKTVQILLPLLLLLPHFGVAASPDLDFDMRIWGGDIALSWPLPGGSRLSMTEALTFVGGGRETASFYRDYPEGSLPGVHADSIDLGFTADYITANITGGVGIRHQLPLKRHRLTMTGLIKSRRELHSFPGDSESLASVSLIPDSARLVDNSLQTGLRLARETATHLRFTPFAIDYALECNLAWSPNLGLMHGADYLRLNANARAYLQLLNKPKLRMYLASRTGVDFLTGATIPMYALSSVGEINAPLYVPTSALGGVVRGIAAGRFNGSVKVYSNNEYRVKLMTKPDMNPMLRLFLDAGWGGYPETQSTENTPIQMSLGMAATLDLMGVAELGYLVAWCPFESDQARRIGHSVIYRAHF